MKTTTSFFEFVGVAGLERLHSQILAWMFSDSCHAFSEKDRLALLNEVFELSDSATHIDAVQTEYEHVDILIATDQHLIAIENKVRTDEHDDQLTRYAENLNKQAEEKGLQARFYFLTLLETSPAKEDDRAVWRGLSYEDVGLTISAAADRCMSNAAGSDGAPFDLLLLSEYAQSLERITAAKRAFLNDHTQFDLVFLNGGTKKHEKLTSVTLENGSRELNDMRRLISSNNFETAFQRLFLVRIVKDLELDNRDKYPWCGIAETRGTALLDVMLPVTLRHTGHQYSFYIQFQGPTVKLNFHTGEGYVGSKAKWVEPLIDRFEEYRASTGYYRRINKPHSKAYISLSKPFNPAGLNAKEWFTADIESIKSEFRKEIELGFRAAEELRKHLINSVEGVS